jgi:hypothetical protein
MAETWTRYVLLDCKCGWTLAGAFVLCVKLWPDKMRFSGASVSLSLTHARTRAHKHTRFNIKA